MDAAKKTVDSLPDLEDQLRQSNTSESLRGTVLSFVAKDKFEIAIRELRYYEQFKSDIRIYQERTARYYDHCEELILAIQTKKNVPNLGAFPMAKRQEIFEKIQLHFDELQGILRRIEQVENDIKVRDARSTIWVIQATILSMVAVGLWAITVETFRSMGLSFTVFFDDMGGVLFKLLGM